MVHVTTSERMLYGTEYISDAEIKIGVQPPFLQPFVDFLQ